MRGIFLWGSFNISSFVSFAKCIHLNKEALNATACPIFLDIMSCDVIIGPVSAVF